MTSPTAIPAENTSIKTKRERARHHPVVRITHWVSAVALVIMGGSGLRIFNASPAYVIAFCSCGNLFHLAMLTLPGLQ